MKKKVVISAFSSDAGESYRFHYGRNHSELVSKQVAKFVESSQGDDNFGSGIESRYFELPLEAIYKLKGIKFYEIL